MVIFTKHQLTDSDSVSALARKVGVICRRCDWGEQTQWIHEDFNYRVTGKNVNWKLSEMKTEFDAGLPGNTKRFGKATYM